ncbi:uncharacterized protein LOC107840829 isoform X3 [Capsicum annuum]|uniref:uncharacterized protein LOC107840829 isoform X3 n=1 Tax=Capsicum annuum TaxID=4072 RepID=UPI001FB06178|nr:uncharacterized protein LOC107840829 isoform X3 [Capsicum annuum]
MERYGNSIFRWDASRSTTPKLGYDISYFRPVIDDALRDQDPQEEWITHACGIHNKLDFVSNKMLILYRSFNFVVGTCFSIWFARSNTSYS